MLIKSPSTRYVKIVEWSEEDQAYAGSAPGLLLGGCHGSDERDARIIVRRVVWVPA